MKAIAIVPGTAGSRLVERPEPSITTQDEVKVRMVRVGICGTDREEVSGGRAQAPDGQTELVIGHEMLGQVVSVGSSVTRVKPGDYAVFTVRRGCGECACCVMNRADMCQTGRYRERGIRGLDGYQTEYAVDQEQYVVRVPTELEPVGVLMEPLSVVEKAIDEALRVQILRCPDAATTPDWFHGRRCLVAGLGPRPRDSVLPPTRSLTLGALIGAPTVREGLLPIAQHHTVEDLARRQISVQFLVSAIRRCTAVPLPLEHTQEAGLAEHSPLHVSFEHAPGGLPIASPRLPRGIEHRRGPPEVLLHPGQVTAEKESIGGPWIRLARVCQQLLRSRLVPQCQHHLSQQNQRPRLLRIEP